MATATNAGYGSEILNVTIDGASWTAVSFTRIPNNVLIASRAGTVIKVSLDSNGSTYFTIPAGLSLTYDWNMGKKDAALYLQGAGADTAEIIATSEGV